MPRQRRRNVRQRWRNIVLIATDVCFRTRTITAQLQGWSALHVPKDVCKRNQQHC